MLTHKERRRLLTPGTEFTMILCGRLNTRYVAGPNVGIRKPEDLITTRRRVVKHTNAEMASMVLTGPGKGDVYWTKWDPVQRRVEHSGNVITVACIFDDQPDDVFARIILD